MTVRLSWTKYKNTKKKVHKCKIKAITVYKFLIWYYSVICFLCVFYGDNFHSFIRKEGKRKDLNTQFPHLKSLTLFSFAYSISVLVNVLKVLKKPSSVIFLYKKDAICSSILGIRNTYVFCINTKFKHYCIYLQDLFNLLGLVHFLVKFFL